MQCKKFKTCMERYGDKALSAPRQSACEEHLKTCILCRQAFAEMEKMKSFFIEAAVPSAPDNLTANIMRRVRNSMASMKSQSENILAQWWKEAAIPVRLAVSATLFVVIAASYFASKDLWSLSTQSSQVYSEYSELDAFSESQKGSLETVYFELIKTPTPSQGGEP
jgi:anti-sigma factor RsiW